MENRFKAAIHVLPQDGDLYNSDPGNVGPGLHNVNLTAHVGPFDVLVLSSEHALDAGGGSGQPPNHVVSQHDTLAGNRNSLTPPRSSNVNRLSSAERVSTRTA